METLIQNLLNQQVVTNNLLNSINSKLSQNNSGCSFTGEKIIIPRVNLSFDSTGKTTIDVLKSSYPTYSFMSFYGLVYNVSPIELVDASVDIEIDDKLVESSIPIQRTLELKLDFNTKLHIDLTCSSLAGLTGTFLVYCLASNTPIPVSAVTNVAVMNVSDLSTGSNAWATAEYKKEVQIASSFTAATNTQTLIAAADFISSSTIKKSRITKVMVSIKNNNFSDIDSTVTGEPAWNQVKFTLTKGTAFAELDYVLDNYSDCPSEANDSALTVLISNIPTSAFTPAQTFYVFATIQYVYQ